MVVHSGGRLVWWVCGELQGPQAGCCHGCCQRSTLPEFTMGGARESAVHDYETGLWVELKSLGF